MIAFEIREIKTTIEALWLMRRSRAIIGAYFILLQTFTNGAAIHKSGKDHHR